MSVICQRFVQNAWRSDLCSNCFKSLEDHSDSAEDRSHLVTSQRYMPQATSLYQSRGISSHLQWRSPLSHSTALYDRVSCRDFGSQTISSIVNRDGETQQTSPGRGILKDTSPHKSIHRSSVGFASEEALVIGYGGNDYDSDDSPWEMGSDDGSVNLEHLDVTEEDRTITRLTKDNTEFNSSNKNLLSDCQLRETKKQEIINTINNNVNNAFRKVDKNLSNLSCVTYNDIQNNKPEKKINQYFFTSKCEPLKSHLHSNNTHVLISDDSRVKNTNIDCSRSKTELIENVNAGNKDKNVKILLNEDYTPLNTTTYSFVSKINKNSNNCDQGSDSDYSTSRLTAGESTDSESFHDSDEARILPCQSFLHGSGSRRASQQAVKDLNDSKTYDAGSSTSGDISNFSDDSDSQTSPERCKTRISSVTHRSSPTATNTKTSGVKANHSRFTTCSGSDTKLNTSSATSPRNEPTNKITQDTPITKTLNTTTSDEAVSCTTNIKSNCPVVQSNVNISEKEFIDTDKTSIAKSSDKRESQQFTGSEISTKPKTRCKTEGVKSEIVKDDKISLSTEITQETVKQNNENVGTYSTKQKLGECKKWPTVDCGSVESPPESKPRTDVTPNSKPSSPDSESKRDVNIEIGKLPGTKMNRQSKLAALALELEQARCDALSKAETPCPPPEVRPRSLPPTTSTPIASKPTPPENNYPSIRRNSAVPSSTRLCILPDVLQETPVKLKKNRFSLKKLLKRNKDSETFTVNGELDRKAWKKHSFDRSRLSLEIVHPMDLTTTSTESTPTEEMKNFELIFAHPSGSLSNLPHLSNSEGHHDDDSLTARKAGTVAERKKKSRPQLVRTPSCSALHGRPSPTTGTPTVNAPQRPPKPPPPPRGPPPPPLPRSTKPASPARPPPPKIPESHAERYSSSQCPKVTGSSPRELREQCNGDGDYANLGDIRSLLTPKKPERPSAFSVAGDNEMEAKTTSQEDTYETLEVADEEDHYTYLDENEVRSPKTKEVFEAKSSSCDDSPIRVLSSGQRPWLDLQTSYAAIAAANYESLAELITTALSEDVECFQKSAPFLKWKDFDVESEAPIQVIEDKIVFNAVHKNHPHTKVTLVVTTQKQHSPQSNRSLTRLPVLANFSDYLPRQILNKEPCSTPHPDITRVLVCVLQRSKVTTIQEFAKETSRFATNQHIHLRNDCFVLLQLIHTLKSLQAEGIEELACDLGRILLVQTDLHKPPILVLLPGDKVYLGMADFHKTAPTVTLCQATLQMLLRLLQINAVEDLQQCVVNGELLAAPVAHTFNAIAKVLTEEKASSLSQAKGLLEYMLWGPVDVKIVPEGSEENVDTILQRWLDLQRAQMVKSLVSNLQLKISSQTGLHIYEEFQLIFLLQATVKSLKDIISKL